MTEPLTCGIRCYLWVDRVRIELNCRTPRGCWELLFVLGGTPRPRSPAHSHLGIGYRNHKRSVLLATGVITLLMMLFYLNNVVIDGLPWSSLGSRELLEVQVVEWLTAGKCAETGAEPSSPPFPSRWAWGSLTRWVPAESLHYFLAPFSFPESVFRVNKGYLWLKTFGKEMLLRVEWGLKGACQS